MYNVNAKKNDSMLILCLIISNFFDKSYICHADQSYTQM